MLYEIIFIAALKNLFTININFFTLYVYYYVQCIMHTGYAQNIYLSNYYFYEKFCRDPVIDGRHFCNHQWNESDFFKFVQMFWLIRKMQLTPSFVKLMLDSNKHLSVLSNQNCTYEYEWLSWSTSNISVTWLAYGLRYVVFRYDFYNKNVSVDCFTEVFADKHVLILNKMHIFMNDWLVIKINIFYIEK